MSKALKYLSEARPEAMSAYFAFLKNNGSSLDDKTKALISIITKVANQTESGLRQYTKKALNNGVSEEEVLDALMMAFPALGLSKILWAVDILLEDKLLALESDPSGEQEKPVQTRSEQRWQKVCQLNDLADGESVITEVAGEYVYASLYDGNIRIFDARCPHHDTNLSYAAINDGEVECPLHGWRFDVGTGQCTRGGQDLRERETKMESGVIYALW